MSVTVFVATETPAGQADQGAPTGLHSSPWRSIVALSVALRATVSPEAALFAGSWPPPWIAAVISVGDRVRRGGAGRGDGRTFASEAALAAATARC